MSRTNLPPRPASIPGSRAGYTLVEILITVAVATLLVALLMPAVQNAREAARVAACHNNVRQLAKAMLHHESARGHLPSGGWGPGWLGIAERSSDSAQPGSWLYNILPYLGEKGAHDAIAGTSAAKAAADYASLAASPVPSLSCPTRRANAPRRLSASAAYSTPFTNKLALPVGVVTDYAANGGSYASCPPVDLLLTATNYVSDTTQINFCHFPNDDPNKQVDQKHTLRQVLNGGHAGHSLDHIGVCMSCDDDMATVAADPASLTQGDQWRRLHPLARIALPDGGIPDIQDGIVHRMSRITFAAIGDGLSMTYLVGEKCVDANRYDAGTVPDAGDDRPLVAGYSSSNVRWAHDPPAQDARGQSQPNVFGSAHRAGWVAAYADGSVSTIGFDIDPAVHLSLSARADGALVNRP